MTGDAFLCDGLPMKLANMAACFCFAWRNDNPVSGQFEMLERLSEE